MHAYGGANNDATRRGTAKIGVTNGWVRIAKRLDLFLNARAEWFHKIIILNLWMWKKQNLWFLFLCANSKIMVKLWLNQNKLCHILWVWLSLQAKFFEFYFCYIYIHICISLCWRLVFSCFFIFFILFYFVFICIVVFLIYE